MQIIKDLEQGSDAWYAARAGIVTMSALDAVLVTGRGDSGFGVGAFTYMHELIGERFTGKPVENFFSKSTQRGHDDEPIACELYEIETDNKVDNVAIILNHGCGYSPDGLIGSDGLIEIKSKLPKFQVAILYENELPKEHEAQVYGGMWCAEREWLDFVSYCDGMPLFIKRVYRDEAKIRNIAERVKIFYELLDQRMETVIKNSRG